MTKQTMVLTRQGKTVRVAPRDTARAAFDFKPARVRRAEPDSVSQLRDLMKERREELEAVSFD